MAATRDELQAYFAKNSIQDKLNSLLNQLVIERPARPFVWLAEQLRNPSIRTSTFDPKPQLSPEDAEQLTRMWDYVVALSTPPGGGAAAAAKPPAAAAAAAGARRRRRVGRAARAVDHGGGASGAARHPCSVAVLNRQN